MSAEPIGVGAVPAGPPPGDWTIADVDALPERDGVRYELVAGVPRMMTPPRWEHQDALLELHLALKTAAPAGLHVVQGLGVIVADNERPIPGLVVVRSGDRSVSNVPAELVVVAAEIVSRSSRTDDRFRKPGLYAQVGIPCYLRVELDPPHVVAYLLGPDGVYEEAGRAAPGEVLTLAEPFPIRIDPAVLVR
jgi:Uma2 family endonuclease